MLIKLFESDVLAHFSKKMHYCPSVRPSGVRMRSPFPSVSRKFWYVTFIKSNNIRGTAKIFWNLEHPVVSSRVVICPNLPKRHHLPAGNTCRRWNFFCLPQADLPQVAGMTCRQVLKDLPAAAKTCCRSATCGLPQVPAFSTLVSSSDKHSNEFIRIFSRVILWLKISVKMKLLKLWFWWYLVVGLYSLFFPNEYFLVEYFSKFLKKFCCLVDFSNLIHRKNIVDQW